MRVLCVLHVSEIPFAVTTTEFLSLWELHGEFVSVGPRSERVQSGKEETERPSMSLSCSIRNRIKIMLGKLGERNIQIQAAYGPRRRRRHSHKDECDTSRLLDYD